MTLAAKSLKFFGQTVALSLMTIAIVTAIHVIPNPWQLCVGNNPRSCTKSDNYHEWDSRDAVALYKTMGVIRCNPDGTLYASNISFEGADWSPLIKHKDEFCRGKEQK